jgi:hypothetical protein
MDIALPATSSLGKYFFLAMGSNLKDKFFRFSVSGYSTERNFNKNILAFGSGRLLGAAANSIPGKDVALVPEMKQSPHLIVPSQDDIPAPASVASVGTSLWNELLPAEVSRTGTTITCSAKYFNIIYKIGT